VLLLGPGATLPVVTGVGLSLPEARRAAVLRGLAVYGSLMIDPRRLHVRGESADPTGDPAQDLAALRAGRWSGFVWGQALADGQPHALAAEAVFPALRGAQPGYWPPPGAAAGYDWEQAVRSGLISQCRRLTLAEIGAGKPRFRSIRWDDAELDARGRRYRSIAKIIGGELVVYDVTGSLQVPTLAFCLDGVTIAYASGFTFGEALRDGLAEVLLSYQARTDDAAESSGAASYAPASVPPLPEQGRPPDRTASPTWATDATATAARLARLGWKAVAVPLDHDPEVTGRVLPYLVNVVVVRD
jgi:ribosomal protein S12 methylthiotransferase accessory factor YcaO